MDEVTGRDYKLICGDCLEVMRDFMNGSICAIITDPPYGIGINKSHRLSTSRGFSGQTWDDKRSTEEITFIRDNFMDLPIAVWGGNYYADILPVSRGWLVWDKVNDGRDFGEAELAWTNKDDVIRMYEKFPVKMDGGKVHPTQKPIELMVWTMEYLKIPSGAVVFDPFGGSMSTGVACLQTGRKFIGIERERQYFDIGVSRMHDAAQHVLLPGM